MGLMPRVRAVLRENKKDLAGLDIYFILFGNVFNTTQRKLEQARVGEETEVVLFI